MLSNSYILLMLVLCLIIIWDESIRQKDEENHIDKQINFKSSFYFDETT